MSKVLFDQFGNEITYSVKAPTENLADLGRVRDPWAGRATAEITPESLARLLRGDTELSEQMALCKKIIRDPHIKACMRNLAHSIARLPWEMEPFDDSADAKRDAKDLTAFFNGMPWLHRMIRQLVYGEFYPFVGVGLRWNLDYKLEGFTPIDPPRWTWDQKVSSLRLRTLREQTKGEPINPRGFVIHNSVLEPGNVRDAGLWQSAAWLWLFKNWTWSAWVRFAENFGNPFIWAFFERPEDKESVLEAVTGMAANARGAFPKGTEIQLQEAQRYGTTALYEKIIEMSEGGLTKLIQGHTLNTDAQSGTGTLAGNAAADVSQQNKEGVGTGIRESIQEQLVNTWYLWNRGEEQVRRGEMAKFIIRTEPPKDQQKKALVYVEIDKVLASSGKTIDPSQLEDEFTIRTVDRPKVQPPAAVSDPAEPTTAPQAASVRAAGAKPRIATLEDVGRVGAALVTSAAEEFSQRILEVVEAADSIESAADAIWTGYRTLETTALASAMRDVTVTANLIGRGDAAE